MRHAYQKGRTVQATDCNRHADINCARKCYNIRNVNVHCAVAHWLMFHLRGTSDFIFPAIHTVSSPVLPNKLIITPTPPMDLTCQMYQMGLMALMFPPLFLPTQTKKRENVS